jgi:hypothetical protein
MKTGFKERVSDPKSKSIVDPWTFHAPPYDERSSCYMHAGTCNGVGKTQPIGHEGNPKSEGVPMGKGRTLAVDYSKRENRMIEIED